MGKILTITPTGTSLLTNTLGISWKEINKYKDQELSKLENRLSTNNQFSDKDKIIEGFNNRKKGKSDSNPAEISSLYGFKSQHQERIKKHDIEILLVHSPYIGKLVANEIKTIIENNQELFGWNCKLKELPELDPDDANKFMTSIEKLTQLVQKQMAREDIDRIYINITCGYKALVPYLTMISMAVGEKIEAFYLFRSSTNVITLPVYPFSFNLRLWRDWRGLLGPFDPDLSLKEEQKKQIYKKAIKKTHLKDLINQDNYQLGALGKWMDSLYKEARNKSLTEFGEGEILLDKLDEKHANYLKDRISYWRHFATGDHIPETVEHGRGHVQRLLELAQQLIIAADIQLTNEQLFVLICSIWLHDLGHSGDGFHFEGKEGIIQDRYNKNSTKFVPVYKDPDSVRKYHNFLSYELLKNEEAFIFGNNIQNDDDYLLRRSIQLTCLYHRKKMPLMGTLKGEIYRVTKGIKDFKEGGEVINGFPLIAAMLRFIDAADNQVERAYSPEHFAVTEWVLNRQAKVLEDEWKKECDASTKAKLDFKRIQSGHYRKHRLVKNVYMVKGKQKNKEPIVEILNIANYDSDDNKLQRLLKDIITDFYEEYILVKDLLPFNIKIKVYEKNDSGGYNIIEVQWDDDKKMAIRNDE